MIMEEGKLMKRMLEDDYDYISDLPDCILIQIISLLPTEDIVRASFVSQRWKSLFSSPLSILDLDLKRFSTNSSHLLNDQKKRFSDFVQCMILLHKDQHHHLKEFRLSIDVSEFKGDIPLIDKWVSFAMTSDSSTLDLDFYGGKESRYTGTGHYTLPVCQVPQLQSVEVLRLRFCKYLPSQEDMMSFKLIKTLVLTMVSCPDDDAFYSFIDNCLCLEELHLIKCDLPEYICFKAPESKLKYLVIDSCANTYEFTNDIKIDIPSLLRFKFAGEVLFNFYMFKPRNLIEAELDIWKIDFGNDDGYDEEDARHNKILRTLLANMDGVNTLTLSSSCIQVLTSDSDQTIELMTSEHESHEILPPPLPNLKHLTLKMIVRRDALNLACLLKSCPNLETLCIDVSCKFLVEEDMSSGNFDDEVEMFWRAYLFPSKYLRCLKKVEIKGFEGRFDEKIFIIYIMLNALVLEEMIIYKAAMKSRRASVKQEGNRKKLTLLKADQRRAIETLLRLKRGSSRARMLLLCSCLTNLRIPKMSTIHELRMHYSMVINHFSLFLYFCQQRRWLRTQESGPSLLTEKK